ncbi:methyltransferase domain-containing protein [Streptomyces sp. NPDC006367]|uniref:methyltransferase domain-containing protein n=1 Tax=unclassified Streptomyces TaxID=2593676 RepID=UPI0033A581DA
MDKPVHGFTAVDKQPAPAEWVGVLDRLNGEPFYAAYKARLHELVGPRTAGTLLEVGAGTGEAALTVQHRHHTGVVAVDRAVTMVRECRARGLRAVAADAHRLPFRTGSFAGAWADRVLQHVDDPQAVIDEMIRVVRPRGRIALADPDYDTQVLDIADQELARKVLRFRADRMLRHGTLAHQHAGLLAARGLTGITVEARTLVVRDPAAVDHVMGLRSWAHTAADHGGLGSCEADRFVALLDEAIAQGRFLYSVTFFLTAAACPGTSSAPVGC